MGKPDIRKLSFSASTTDDLFKSTVEASAPNNAGNTFEIPLDAIDPFPNHPFKVVHDEEMTKLAESIKEYGVFNKIILRPKGNRYELIAGHRRVAASKLAGKETIPAIVEDMDDERATMIMVDSNLRQRQELLPSEKAFAYRMRLEAMNRRGQRTDLALSQVGTMFEGESSAPTVSQVGTRKRSDQILAEEIGESRNQIQRFIRLTYLTKPLLELVDNKKFPFNPAVELSYLTEKDQMLIYDIMQRDKIAPSLEQVKRLREASEKGELNQTVLSMVFMDDKPANGTISLKAASVKRFYPNATPKEIEASLIDLAGTYTRLKEFFPPNTTQEEITDSVIKLVVERYGK